MRHVKDYIQSYVMSYVHAYVKLDFVYVVPCDRGHDLGASSIGMALTPTDPNKYGNTF